MIASFVTRRWPRAGRGGRHYARALLVPLAGAGLAAALAAGPASAATAPPPAPGVAPGSTVVGSTVVTFYTASDGSVWMKNLLTGAYTPAGGHVIAAPSAITSGASAIVFGVGTDNQMWMNSCNLSGSCGSWQPLGGDLFSKPGAVFQGPNVADYSVYGSGLDGAVWGRTHTTAGWGAWSSLGGDLLNGTGPSAAYLGGTYVLAVGTNHQLYIAQAGVTGFVPVGGATTGSPALTAIPASTGAPAALVGFARGTDNVGYYHRFLSNSPGWHSMGGNLSSGLSASPGTGAGATTLTFGLGTDSQIYESAGTWNGYPPVFSGWHLVS